MPKTVLLTSADIDLLRVAARIYGDATAWLTLATALGQTTADIPTGITKLTAPDFVPSMSGSIPGPSQ